jgi:PAS domain S-box-containing protein
MADTAPVMIWVSDTAGQYIYFNQQWLSFTGRAIDNELGGGWTNGVHPDDLERRLAAYNNAFNLLEPFNVEYRLRRVDGQFRWVYDSGIPRLSPNGSFMGYTGSCIDITERKAAEQSMADLSGQLIRARENECARIAGELHDDLNQRLALICVQLEGIRQNPPTTDHRLREDLDEILRETREVSGDIHRMSYDLHPSKLVHLGLVTTVTALCRDLRKSHGLETSFSHSVLPVTLHPDVSLCLYRIVQECLNNVIRHSGSKRAEIELAAEGEEIRLRVSDSGRGFDVESSRIRSGLGLLSMRERLRLIGGTISIESHSSRGTDIKASVPLSRIGLEQEDLVPQYSNNDATA